MGLEAGRAAFVASLDRNLIHCYVMAHLCLPHLRARRGAIVNVSSKTALTGQGASHTTGQWVFVDGGYTHLDRAVGAPI